MKTHEKRFTEIDINHRGTRIKPVCYYKRPFYHVHPTWRCILYLRSQ